MHLEDLDAHLGDLDHELVVVLLDDAPLLVAAVLPPAKLRALRVVNLLEPGAILPRVSDGDAVQTIRVPLPVTRVHDDDHALLLASLRVLVVPLARQDAVVVVAVRSGVVAHGERLVADPNLVRSLDVGHALFGVQRPVVDALLGDHVEQTPVELFIIADVPVTVLVNLGAHEHHRQALAGAHHAPPQPRAGPRAPLATAAEPTDPVPEVVAVPGSLTALVVRAQEVLDALRVAPVATLEPDHVLELVKVAVVLPRHVSRVVAPG